MIVSLDIPVVRKKADGYVPLPPGFCKTSKGIWLKPVVNPAVGAFVHHIGALPDAILNANIKNLYNDAFARFTNLPGETGGLKSCLAFYPIIWPHHG